MMIACPEGMERDGGDDVRTCTDVENSAVGVWNGTAPVCAGLQCLLTSRCIHIMIIYQYQDNRSFYHLEDCPMLQTTTTF